MYKKSAFYDLGGTGCHRLAKNSKKNLTTPQASQLSQTQHHRLAKHRMGYTIFTDTILKFGKEI